MIDIIADARSWRRSVLGLLLVLSCACSDSPLPRRDAGPRDRGSGARDGAADGALAANIGAICRGAADCLPGSPICLTFDEGRGLGVCTRRCTPDDPATVDPLNEDDCRPAAEFACAKLLVDSAFCLRKCTPSLKQDACPPEQACHPATDVWLETRHRALCWRPRCRTDRDCPVRTATLCARDGQCASHGAAAFCARDGRCALPGRCAATGLCAPHAHGKDGARVGDPCNSDLDCSASGACLNDELDDASFPAGPGAQDRRFPRGYCTVPFCAFSESLPEYECPSDAVCHQGFPGGHCFKRCELADPASCRGQAADRGGDYECYRWTDFTTPDGRDLASAPICGAAALVSCARLPVGAGCDQLGAPGNPTRMACRDVSSGAVLADPRSAAGRCLDETASGSYSTPPRDGG